MGRSGLRAVQWAGACLLWSGAVLAAEGPDWRVCFASSQAVDGMIHFVQSEPFDARPSATFEERMAAQRPFESPLKALGVARLRDAAVECTDAAATREEAARAGEARRAAVMKYKLRLVAGPPWVVDLKPGETVAPVLVGLGELASPATRASSPERWGLSAQDFSRMHGDALRAKAGLPARKPELQAAADKGDAYAQYLIALQPEGKADDMVMMKRAADQGLVRAIVDVNVSAWIAEAEKTPPGSRVGHELSLLGVARLGSAHANFWFARLVGARKLSDRDLAFAQRSLQRANALEYAPAQLFTAEVLSKSTDEAARGRGRALAGQAAAQGYAPARAFLAAHPE